MDETQLCTKCGAEKPLEAFGWRSRAKGIRHKRCKACVSAYNKQHYSGNKAAYKAKARNWNEANKRIAREYIAQYLLTHPCVDCGESDPVVLEFDHVRGEKRAEIAKLVRNYVSLDVLKAEIAKCEVRCGNCHRRKSLRESGHWMLDLMAADDDLSETQGDEHA